jgi:hypothetical protein
MAIIRIRQGDRLNMPLITGNHRVGQRAIHQTSSDLQALNWNSGHVSRKIPNPFVVNLIRPARIDQAVYRNLHDDVP